jgi:SM-20-related protein
MLLRDRLSLRVGLRPGAAECCRSDMPPADFFTSFGFFIERDFLDATFCDELRETIEAAPGLPGRVLKVEEGDVVDEDYRRTVTAEVSDATRSRMTSRFEQLMPEVARHFETELRECQAPALLRYKEGDFFHAHSDNGHERVAARRISAVAFLNDERDDPEPGSYSGGSLAFFGLVGDERGEKVGFPLAGEKGLLVAFPSDRIHSVTPVTRGERYTAVTWFV